MCVHFNQTLLHQSNGFGNRTVIVHLYFFPSPVPLGGGVVAESHQHESFICFHRMYRCALYYELSKKSGTQHKTSHLVGKEKSRARESGSDILAVSF